MPNIGKEGMTILDDLERAVLEDYLRESDDATHYERSSSAATLSVKDLNLQAKETSRHNTLKLEVLQGWRELVSALKRDLCFLAYTQNLQTAFAISRVMDASQYRHIKTLVNLLTNTVENRKRDNSTECRFVTLLEVLLSYGKKWKPSEQVSAFWVRLMQRVPHDVPPVNFRRRAYRVLVSLSWVPSSKGLLEACSFDANRQSIDPEKAPARVQAHFSKIRGRRPQPRFDCVNQLLDRLKDETDVCVAITSEREGMGKTTLAALVASHPSILRVFRVLWLQLSGMIISNATASTPSHTATSPSTPQQFSYQAYTTLLDDLAQQFNTSITWPQLVKRFEEPALRRLREHAAMQQAKQMMQEFCKKQDENILLILDECADSRIIEWFRFSERQSIIVTTTPTSNILTSTAVGVHAAPAAITTSSQSTTQSTATNPMLTGVDWTVELGPMSDEEAIALFLSEANFPPTHVLGLTVELRSLVRACDCHPLTVRTLGRWFQLKQVTAGIVKGIEELCKEMDSVVPGGMSGLLGAAGSGNLVGGGADCGATTMSFLSNGGSSVCAPVPEIVEKPENENSLVKVGDNGLKATNSGDLTSAAETLDESTKTPLLYDILSLMMGPVRIEGTSTSILFVICLASMAVVFPHQAPLDSLLLLWEHVLTIEPHSIDELSQKNDPTPSFLRKQAWFVAEGLTHMGVISLSETDSGDPWVEVHHKLYSEFAMFMAKEMDLAETYEKTAEAWNKAFVAAYVTYRMDKPMEEVDANSWKYSIEKLPQHIFQAKMFSMAESILSEEGFFRSRIDAMGWEKAVDIHIADCIKLQSALEAENDNSWDSLEPISPVFDNAATIVATQAEGALGISEDKFVVEVSRALFKIGIALAENGHFDEAIAQFENAQNMLPQSQELRASILYGAAWCLLATNSSEKALKKIKASKKIMDEYVRGHVLYKEALQLQGVALVGECDYKIAAEFFAYAVEELRADSENSKIELGATLAKQGRLFHTMGELAKAKSVYNECLNCKLQMSESSRGLASVYSALGDISMEERNLSAARGYYENGRQVLDAMRIKSEDVDHLLLTGKLRYLQSDQAGSLEALEKARKLTIDFPKLFMDQSAYDLRCIARIYQARGDLHSAVTVLQESLSLTDARPYSLERASGLHELANCLMDQDQMSAGLITLEDALEIRIRKLGECLQVLDTLNATGTVHMSMGAKDDALAVFCKVYELTERVATDDVERIAGVLYSIGEVYDAKREYAQAMEKFNECMEVLKRDRSEDHPHIAKALQRLGDVTAAQRDLDTAYNYYSAALRIRKEHEDEKQLAETLHSLGVLLRKKKDIKAAREYLLDALDLRRKNKTDNETGETLFEIANTYRLDYDTNNSINIYEKSLEVLGEGHNLRGSVYLALGHCKLSLAKDREALGYYQRALEVRLAAYGKDNLKTGNVARSIGLLKYLMNEGDEAILYLNEFMRVIEINDEQESEDVDYIVSVLLMFDIHYANGKKEQAQKLLGIAKDVSQKSEEVRAGIPALVDMIKRRYALISEPQNKPNSIFTRFNLQEEAATQLKLDPKEAGVLRQLVFIDD